MTNPKQTDAARELEVLLRERPMFHARPDGSLISYALNEDALSVIAREVRAGMTTLETGAGYSSVLFASAGANHTVITHTQAEADRILAYCLQRGFPSQPKFVVGNSDRVLPTLTPAAPLDFAFIDGGHGFPLPQIDWYYSARLLRVGGLMGLDDIHIPSVRQMHDYLLGEPEWEPVETLPFTCFFRKVKELDYSNDWEEQAMNRPLFEAVEAANNRLPAKLRRYFASIPACKALYRRYFKKTSE
jgi:predicted O-methyltransferase YrrM